MEIQTIPSFPLTKGRAHDVCGAGASFFAFALAGQVGGSILWVREAWQSELINPAGFAEILDPRALLVATAKDQTEVLAVAEEALRSGAVSVVVMELSKPMSLTAGRRLQLAARDGKSTALGIIPEGMGSNAAETRWQCDPVFDPGDSTLQRWTLTKNKSGTLGGWYVRWDATSRRLAMVSPAGQRTGSAGAPD
ncbi:MAG: hypothetical protein P1U83_06630 [Roseovarius sp.]|nr:hypothetical protein [Roseovarius sp.]